MALTRAKEKLYLSNAHMRTMYGQIKPYLPSRFIDEIPQDLLTHVESDERQDRAFQARRRETASRVDYAMSEVSVVNKPKPQKEPKRYDWKVGDTAVHNLWGKGKLVAVMGSDSKMMLKIEFPGNKIRQVMVAFAPITKGE